ncbi:MAG: hypothetical protein EOO20_03965 [Chryseobacterium sp.]|nr:MAG: hypothetical protein EOO20_03965 [Chryseobacterium sp.]
MLTITRNTVPILTNIPPDLGDYVQKQRNGIDFATLNWVQIGDTPTDLQLDDSVTILGTTYSLISKPPVVEKIDSRKHRFQCVFEAEHYKMKRVKYFFLNPTNNLKEKAFTIMGDLSVFVGLIKMNLDRDNPGKWTIGTVEVTEARNISFDNLNCLSAIAQLESEFQTEFWMNGNQMNFTSKAKNNGFVFKYGQGNGLYNITRSPQDDESAPITRLSVFGGSRNLPAGYRNYANTLQLDDPIELPTTLPLNEETITFPEIFPQYLGTVTAVGNEFSFSASAMPFNLNDQLLPGLTAKVIFQTGLLAGYEIEVASYDNTNKTFVVNKVESEKDLEIPSPDLHAEVGDTFIIVDMDPPIELVQLAEQQLYDFGLDYYKSNNFHKRNYAVTPDRMHFKKQAIKLEVADHVRLIDGPLGVDRLIPIESFKTFYARSEWDNELTLSDYPIIDPYTRLIRQQIKQAQNGQPKPPIQSPGIYVFNRKGTFQKQGCGIGFIGEAVNFERKYTSIISYANAMEIGYADTSFNVDGQANADSTGSCINSGPVTYTPVRFWSYARTNFPQTCTFMARPDYVHNPDNDIIGYLNNVDNKVYVRNYEAGNEYIPNGFYYTSGGPEAHIDQYVNGAIINSGDCLNGFAPIE